MPHANQHTLTPVRKAILVIGPSIAYVPLTRGLFALIDSDSIDLASLHNWHAAYSDYRKVSFYACRWGGFMLHKLLCVPPDGFRVDHKNRNTFG